jgi:protein-S-isoprenylcysteine O-methyltransferase Ste14
MMFDQAFNRFALSGTLLGLYGLVEWWSVRKGAGRDRPQVPSPRWLSTAGLVSLGAFYLLIGPAGGSVAGGWGNLAGVVLATGAMAIRYAVRHGHPRVRHPATAARMLFYGSLPLAVGVPWGWLALTAPALAIWAYCNAREDRILGETLGESYRARIAGSQRWIPGVW